MKNVMEMFGMEESGIEFWKKNNEPIKVIETMGVVACIKCKTEYAGKYCPQCGYKHDSEDINAKTQAVPQVNKIAKKEQERNKRGRKIQEVSEQNFSC